MRRSVPTPVTAGQSAAPLRARPADTGPAPGARGPAGGRDAGRTRRRLGRAAGLAAVAVAALAAGAAGACDRPARPAEPAEARGLRALALGSAALLPRAAVGEPPVDPAGVGAFHGAVDVLPRDDRSYSLGTTSRGRLVAATPLPDGADGLRARPISLERGAVHGTEELVAALARAARAVAARWPGSVLWAGDLSAPGGGDIPGHVSHNSGRDADLAFYLRDGAGRIADSPAFERVGVDGRTSGAGHHFDDARNWALLEALLKDPHVQVQYVFVASHLQERLLAFARGAGASEALLARAARVMRQPSDSSPHAEHFHVRLYCALEERVEGCLDNGAVHPWVDTFDEALARRVAEVLPFLRSGQPDEIRYAVTRLVRLRARAAVDHLLPLREHPRPDVARLADDAVAFLRGERTPPAWADLVEEDAGE